MTREQWPLRWDLLLRYRLIEIIALWEGRLTTNHLCDTFGIQRQQASKDINNYINEQAQGNLVYDKRLKGYKPTEAFRPRFTSGTADEYLHLMARNNELNETFHSLSIGIRNTAILDIPIRDVKPQVVRTIVAAARNKQRIEVDYVSLSKPSREGRIICPHTLVFTGLRWHVRAWCEKNQDFRDFVLSRFRGEPEVQGDSAKDEEHDALWSKMITIRITPDSRLTPEQQDVIRHDYGMHEGPLEITVRAPLVHYALKQLNIDPHTVNANAVAQQIVVENLSEISPYLLP